VRGVEHEVVLRRGQLFVDAPHDLTDVIGVEIADNQTDYLRAATGQTTRLAVDHISCANQRLGDPSPDIVAHVALAANHPGYAGRRDIRLAGDVIDGDAPVVSGQRHGMCPWTGLLAPDRADDLKAVSHEIPAIACARCELRQEM
jgi:hypothetical protein